MYGRGQPTTRNESPFARLLAQARREGTPDVSFGQRCRPRFALGAALSARFSDGGETAWPVTMQNISEGGMAIQSHRPLATGAVILLRDPHETTPGSAAEVEVVHCTAIGDGYLVGVKFRDEIEST